MSTTQQKNKVEFSQTVKADNQLYAAVRRLHADNLLYYEVLRKINIIVEPNFPLSIGAIGYNPQTKKVYMILREKEMAEVDIKDCAGLIEHECGHLLYDHIFYPDRQKDKRVENMARDYIINSSGKYLDGRLSEIKDPSNKSPLAGGLFYSDLQPTIPELKDRNVHDMTSNELYEILMRNGQASKPKPGKGKPQKGEKGQGETQEGQGDPSDEMSENEGFDDHNVLKVSEDPETGELKIEGGENLTPEDMNEIQGELKKSVKQALETLKQQNELAKAIGQLSGDIKNMVTEMIKTRTDKNVILNFCETLFSGSRRTWNKLNKRYRWIAKGVRLKKRAKIVVGIDTSGSMNSDSCRKQIVDQIEKLQPLCDELWICAGDTQLEWSLHIEDMNSFRPEMIQFEGGGGTNMQFVFDFAESIEADGIVLHTDGFVGTFDDKDIQTICYLYDHCEDVEGYENVRVYPE